MTEDIKVIEIEETPAISFSDIDKFEKKLTGSGYKLIPESRLDSIRFDKEIEVGSAVATYSVVISERKSIHFNATVSSPNKMVAQNKIDLTDGGNVFKQDNYIENSVVNISDLEFHFENTFTEL